MSYRQAYYGYPTRGPPYQIIEVYVVFLDKIFPVRISNGETVDTLAAIACGSLNSDVGFSAYNPENASITKLSNFRPNLPPQETLIAQSVPLSMYLSNGDTVRMTYRKRF